MCNLFRDVLSLHITAVDAETADDSSFTAAEIGLANLFSSNSDTQVRLAKIEAKIKVIPVLG